MSEPIRIMLVDDHQIIHDGISGMLSEQPEIAACITIKDPSQVMERIALSMPDIVITDISMPELSGIDLIRQINSKYPLIGVIVLSMYLTEDFIFNAVKAGAKGYLAKQDTNKNILIEAIHEVRAGREYYSASVSQTIMKTYSVNAKKLHTPVEQLMKKHILTSREREILRFYAEGFTNQEIADKLNISIRTVETHKNNIMQKFNFKSNVEMVKFAIRNKIVDV